MNMHYLWLSSFWILYFTIHSVLAATQVKKTIQSMGVSVRMYRFVYNILAFILLLPIVYYLAVIPFEFAFLPTLSIKFLGLAIGLFGALIAKKAFASYNTRAFLGLGDMQKEDEFTVSGLLQYVRHPLYSATILMVSGYFLYQPKWSVGVSAFLVILYVVIGIQFEERKLIRQFGNRYLDYKKSTPMLIPRIWGRKK